MNLGKRVTGKKVTDKNMGGKSQEESHIYNLTNLENDMVYLVNRNVQVLYVVKVVWSWLVVIKGR